LSIFHEKVKIQQKTLKLQSKYAIKSVIFINFKSFYEVNMSLK